MSHSHDVDCMAVLQRFWDYLDAELGTADMAAMREHLERCSQCDEYVRYHEAFLAALAAAREGGGCPETLRKRVYATLAQAGFGRGGATGGAGGERQ